MFSSVTSSVSNWFKVKPDEEVENKADTENKQNVSAENKENVGQSENVEPSDLENLKQDDSSQNQQKGNIDLEEVSAKAINTAKEWGSYLYTFGKAATDQVSKTAKQFKDAVEEKTILGEFSREQEKFIQEKQDKDRLSEAALPPWVGYNEEEAMKQQILALSQDKRNFLRNPPSGVQFQFDYEGVYPVALATLSEDPNLQKMRFELVPKQINEESFWRNYFYRVSLIKQSTQLTALAQQTGTTAEVSSSKTSSQHSSDSENGNKESSSSEYDRLSDVMEVSNTESQDSGNSKSRTQPAREPDDLPTGSPPENEFVSDAFQDKLNEEDLKREMEQLGMNDKQEAVVPPAMATTEDDIPEWEKELQAELQEYEVVDDGKVGDDAELEQEILQQIEEEAKRS